MVFRFLRCVKSRSELVCRFWLSQTLVAMIGNVRESLTPICSQLPIYTSSCPRVLGSVESYASTDNTEVNWQSLQKCLLTLGSIIMLTVAECSSSQHIYIHNNYYVNCCGFLAHTQRQVMFSTYGLEDQYCSSVPQSRVWSLVLMLLCHDHCMVRWDGYELVT